jgi:hypothetical protein
MKPPIFLICAAALLPAAAARAGGAAAQLPPLPPAVETAGRTVGGAGGRAFLGAGKGFAGAGRWVGHGCSEIFFRQGRFWKRTANSLFADFRERPAGTPPRYDQM